MTLLYENESQQRGLVGRDDEIEKVRSLIDSAPGGGDGLVVLGDPGIGKTAPLSVAIEHAAQAGFTILELGGVESERDLPYAGLDLLLRPILDAAGALPAVQRYALLTAVGLADGPAPTSVLLGRAVLNLISGVAARTPVLVAVDDVHLLDAPTHDVLAFVARRAGRAAIAVVGTARKGTAGPFVSAGLPELDVLALSDAAARDLLARSDPHLGSVAREEVLRDALGNPLALIELPIARRTGDPSRPLTACLERVFRIQRQRTSGRDARRGTCRGGHA